MYRNALDIYLLILYSVTLLNFIQPSRLLYGPLRIFYTHGHAVCKWKWFYFFFSYLYVFYFLFWPFCPGYSLQCDLG